jgi:hypothetical protein
MKVEEERLRDYMKSRRKSKDTTERIVQQLRSYEATLSEKGLLLEALTESHLDDIVSENRKKPSKIKSIMRALMFYFTSIGNDALAVKASSIRESLIVRKPLKLRDIMGVERKHIQVLEDAGISDVTQMLNAGKTREQRNQLASQTKLPVKTIEEFVHLSDLARIFAVKKVRARLYNDAGVDTIEKMANLSPEELIKICTEFIQRTGFNAIPPTPKEAEFTVLAAGKLPSVIDW